jgi:hypothetical protein
MVELEIHMDLASVTARAGRLQHLEESFHAWRVCGAELMKLNGSIHIEKAILEGRTYVGTKNTEWRKE